MTSANGLGRVHLEPEPDVEFNWSSGDVVVDDRCQQAIAVYPNGLGALCIRQKADWPHEPEDSVIIVYPEHLTALIKTLSAFQPAVRHQQAAEPAKREGSKPAYTPRAPRKSGAARQARYRNKRRGVTVGDAESDGESVTPLRSEASPEASPVTVAGGVTQGVTRNGHASHVGDILETVTTASEKGDIFGEKR